MPPPVSRVEAFTLSNHPAGWVNVCEPEAVRLFLRMTHEVYEKRLAHYFASKTILGIFTDEPGHPVAISDDVPHPCEIPARGVLVLGPGERPAAPGTPIELGSLAYALDREIFGDHDRPDAQWDMRFWNPQHDSETAPGLFAVKSL